MKTRNGTFVFGLIVAFALLMLFQGGATASTPNSDSPLGANLHIFAEWSTEYTMVDAFKQSSGWLTQDIGKWNTGEINEIDFDANGWPRSLESTAGSADYSWLASTIFLGLEGHYPAGQYPDSPYTVVYDGQGTIEYGHDATVAERLDGKDLLHVTPSNQGILLKITETDPEGTGDYIRNIRVFMPGYDENSTELFHHTFIENTQNYKVLRFMDWMRTNWKNGEPARSSDVSQDEWSHPLDAEESPYFNYIDPQTARSEIDERAEWGDRPKVDHARYTTTNGVPLEVMIKLANEIDADPWFNMPHHASDEYMLQFALMVRNRLEANRHVYVELSNEAWNGGINANGDQYGFYQAVWFQLQGMRQWPDSSHADYVKGLNYFGMRSAEMCDLWELAFGAQADRVVCVIATQAADDWKGEQTLTCPLWAESPCHAHHVDAVAIAPYFGQHVGRAIYHDDVTDWITPTSDGLSELFTELRDGTLLPAEQYVTRVSLPVAQQFMHDYATIAEQYNIDLLAYEGGQHLVGVEGSVVSDPVMTELFGKANRDPRMAAIYAEYYEHWRAAGGKMFMHYATLGAYSKHGNWGAQEYADSIGMPKIAANYEYIDTYQCDWTTCDTPGSYTPTAVTMNNTHAAAQIQIVLPVMLLLLLGATAWLRRA